MHIANDTSLERRRWGQIGDKPWYCYLWPPACDGDETSSSSSARATTSTTRRQQTSTPTPKPPPPATTPRTTVPRPTPPAATQPPAAPPADTQSPKPPPRPQPDPSPTSQSPTTPPMPPPVTSTGNPAQPTTAVVPVEVQPNDDGGNSPGTEPGTQPTPTDGNGSGTGASDGNGNGNGNGGSVNTGDAGSGLGSQPGQTGVPSANDTPATPGPGPGGIEGSGNPGESGPGNRDTSGGGLPPGAIGGIVVGLLLLLLALLALLLYRFRRRPAVQRMLAPFYRLGGGLGGVHRGDTPGGDGMGRNLISPAPGAAPVVGAAVAAAAAGHDRDPPSQPDMGQAGYLHPLVVPGAAARQARDSNRISVFTNNSASTGFLPSPVSPLSPASVLSPGAVRTSRPIQAQPDPRVLAPATAHVSRGSVSTISDTSGISAGLSPGQMTWPMPPGTPPAIQTPDGPQYLNFQQSGQTVVRINQPPRSNRRSGGY